MDRSLRSMRSSTFCVDLICIKIFFLTTPLWKKKSSSVDMANEKEDKSKIDPNNVISVEYGDVPEDQHKTIEAYIQ